MNELLIYSDIGESFFYDSVSAKSVKSAIAGMSGDLSVRINSPGGDVFDGFAIYNMLAQYDGKVTVHIDGLAASAASVIAMAGDEIVMADNALMMIHDPWTISVGDASEMRTTADLLDKIKGSIVTTYLSKTVLDEADVADKMAAETWFNADEAVEYGFATSKVSESAKIANSIEKPWIKNAPRPAANSQPETDEEIIAWRIALNRKRLALLS
jgi:ATP-dependent Clp protease protease subunit